MGEQVEMAFSKHAQFPVSPSSLPPPAGEGGVASYDGRSSFTCNEAKLRKTELSLRIATIVCALAGLVLLVTDKQTRSFIVFQSVITQEALTKDMKALVFSVVTLGIAVGYSVLQAIRCIVASPRQSFEPSFSFGWGIFLFDQVMAYLLLTSSSASAQAAYFSEQGSDGFQWTKVCYLYEHFCQQVGAGIISSFVAFMGLALTSFISGLSLFGSVGFDK